ncbi:MAG: amidohydrolase family protein [Candidatus Pacebacteria bacterium]|nr:amidohydrolase family protein [Candidatus Paceibacterota bacterium]
MPANTPFIDAHTHVYTDEAYAAYQRKAQRRARKIMSIQYWTTAAEPRYSLRDLIAFAEGKDVAIVAAVNILHPIGPQLEVLERHLPQIVGVKMYPGYQHFYPHDRMVHPVAAFCEKHAKPLMFHSGSMSARGTPLLKYSHPIHLDELAGQFPACSIVMAHCGFPYLLEAAAIMSKNKNVFADISGTIDAVGDTAARERLAQRYRDDMQRVVDYYPDISEKLLFGTDFSGEHTHLNEVSPYVELVESIWSREDQERIFSKTAEKLYRI